MTVLININKKFKPFGGRCTVAEPTRLFYFMTELIKITEKEGKQAVSAKALYEFLGYKPSHWKRWHTKNIETNPYFAKGEDYEGFTMMVNGNETKDFALTLDTCKKIAMSSQTDKGNKARQYFIECEKKANQQLPQTKLEWMQLAVESEKGKQLAESKVQSLEEALDESEQWISIIRASKEYEVKETSFKWRVLKKYSLENGIEIKTAPCPRYKTKKLYHVSVFKNCYPKLK